MPCISLNRWPYEEYHTTDDNLDIMQEDMLVGAADVAEKIIRIYASNYIPKRTFRGPVFLSGNGLWVDWRENWELNRAIEKIMMRFEGQHSVFDIAEQVGLDYGWCAITLKNSVQRFYDSIADPIRGANYMKQTVVAIIQGRMSSSRLPGKIFADIAGHPRLQTRLYLDLAGG